MIRKRTFSTVALVFALIMSFMATAIAAQPVPPDDEPEISDSIDMQVTVLGEETVFDVRLCPTDRAGWDGESLVLNSIEPRMDHQLGGEQGVRICYTDTKASRGPYVVFLVADDFVSTTSPEVTIGADNLNISAIWPPRSASIGPNSGLIYARDGVGRLDPVLISDGPPGRWNVRYSHSLDTPVIVGEVTAGQGSIETSMILELVLTVDHDGPRGTFTSTLYLDVYSVDTP